MSSTHGIVRPTKQDSQRRTPAFLAGASLVLGALLVLLAGCGTTQPTAAAQTQQARVVRQGQVRIVPAPAISTTIVSARRHLYTFATSNVGLMQPVVDAQGNVWVGEMNVNSLGLLDTRTGAVKSWSLPNGQYGIMTTLIDAQGNIWYSEQFADYIGRFDPVQHTFRTFPLGTWKGVALGPQNMQFDAQGKLWFTASDGNAIGRLDPQTGAVHIWSLPASPSGLVVAPNGTAWFGYLTGGSIGSLDPATGQITLYALQHTQAQVYAMTMDSAGHLWFTEASPGRLGMFDPATDSLTEFPIPAIDGSAPTLSELVIDRQGDIWFVDVAANMLVRYIPGKQTYTFYRLSLSPASPFALTLSPTGNLWFTAGNAAVNYLGEMAP